MRRSSLWIVALCFACDDEPGNVSNAGDDTGTISGQIDGARPDAAIDAAPDAFVPPPDAAPDALVPTPDAASDGAPADAALDGPTPDLAVDARVADADLTDAVAPDGAVPDAADPDQGAECVVDAPCDTGRPGPCADGRATCPDGPAGAVRCERVVMPAAEVCDGIDNDCDGGSDEGFQGVGDPCVAGRGVCAAAGVMLCGGCTAEAGEPGVELCDGLDNDCDGSTDEAFADLGRPCSAGRGLCAGRSVWRCDGEGELVCDAEATPPVAELCDGLDNDCDGETDEGFVVGEACTVGEGACLARGQTECQPDGNGTRCSGVAGLATTEVCDLVDNDCDGAVDEGPVGGPLTRACYTGPDATEGVGACHGGTQTCDEFGLWARCEGQVGPFPETCDGQDRDCDGSIDEAFVADCYSGPVGTDGHGACARGERRCDDGVLSGCLGEVVPGVELCDDIDNDCDDVADEGLAQACFCEPGQVDECYGGPPGTEGVGACRLGTQACQPQGLGFEACDDVRPAAEVCDGVDNDCDQAVDEDVGAGQPCTVGVGACARQGVRRCLDGVGSCVAEPGRPEAERCNGVDDDCDGTADEGIPLGAPCEVGEGVCARSGETVCGPLGEAVCGAVAGAPRAETCDGADDDCDGATDEGFQVGADCRVGEGACQVNARWACAPDGRAQCGDGAGDPAAEACNAVDDDCDGRVDEGLRLGEVCQGGGAGCAREGVRACAGGEVVCQVEAADGGEVCNGGDDDCDGSVDEGNPGGGEPCDTGAPGVCGPGTSICLAAQVRCIVVVQATDEACDGLDNDCDGTVDEDFGGGDECRVGVGACERVGRLACDENGDIRCSAGEGDAGEEVCNGFDDDCDGTVDEDPPGVGDDCVGGLGLCAADGLTACTDGELGCDAPVGDPVAEACNADDDDCDGTVDEDFEPGAVCAVGVGACVADGAWACDGDGGRVCEGQPGDPVEESCNGVDDDCDGTTDEFPCVDEDPPTVRIALDPPVANVGQRTRVTVEAEDLFEVVGRTLTIDGDPVELDDDHGAFFASNDPGAFEVQATATDDAGNEGRATEFIRVRDPQDFDQPFVRVTFPEDGAELTGVTTVRGTATDAAFFRYTVDISGDLRSWFRLDEGFQPVEDQPVAEIDPTLMAPGFLYVRLTGEDLSGNNLFHIVTYRVPDGISVGEYRITIRDLDIGLWGLPIQIDRTYDSRRRVVGDFGIGWSLERRGVLQEDINSNVAVKLPDGRREVFGKQYDFNPIFPFGTVSWPSPRGIDSTLEAMDGCLVARTPQGVLCTFSGRTPQATIANYRLTVGDGTIYEMHDTDGIRRVIDPGGNTLNFERARIWSSNGMEVEIERDLADRVLAIRDPLGGEIRYFYDPRGRLERVVDQAGGEQRYTYDDAHLLLDVIAPDGSRMLRTEYDDDGRKVRDVDALGHATEYVHDLDGRREVVTDRRGNATTYDYDAQGNVLTRTDALGNTITYVYDADGRLESETDGNGAVTRYAYDDRGRQTGVTDGEGNAWTFAFDQYGRTTEYSDPEGETVNVGYDDRGQTTRIENTTGEAVAFTYDGVRRTTQTDADGNVFEFTYDGDGNLVEIAGPGGFTRSYAYDELGRLTGITEPDGGAQRFDWDALGRLTGFTNRAGDVWQLERDPMGRLGSITDPTGAVTRYEYEPRGQADRIVDALGGETTYTYDETGNLESVTDANGHVRSYEYDALDQASACVGPLGGRTEFVFDANGRLLSRTTPRGAETLYAYDDNGMPTSVRHADGSEFARTYDGARRVVSSTDPTGVTRFEYDGDDRLTQVTSPQGVAVSYTYGARGERASRTTPEGRTDYAIDGLGQLTGVGDLTIERDAQGNVTAVNYPGGARVNYTYDAADRPTGFELRDGDDAVVLSETLTLDGAGRVVRIVDQDGAATDLDYDALGRLTQGLGAYAYDAVGNRTGGGRMYDAADRLLADPEFSYRWDADGNLVERTRRAEPVVETFAYDGEDRLARYTGGGVEVRYAYDTLGRLVSRTRDGVVTRYGYDFAELALELDGDGNVRAEYVHGDRFDEALLMRRGGVEYGYVLNARGDVVALVTGGEAVETYSYGDFGETVAEGVPNPLRFQGRIWDPDARIYHFRARAYDPQTGRFLQRDPEKGTRMMPGTQHPYSYARNDPYVLRDPSGRATVVSYAWLSSRFVTGSVGAEAPNMYEYSGSFIGFFHGFGGTALVFIANILEIANSGGDIRQQWGAAIDKTAAKMKEIEQALGRVAGLDDSGFGGAFVNGAKFKVGIKITVKPGFNIPKPVGKAVKFFGGKTSLSKEVKIEKAAGGFKSGVKNYLDYLRQITPQ